jgi:hypothetical protein
MAPLKPFLNDTGRAAADGDALLEAFVAGLTCAAYHVALRHGAAGRWLDLQLALWQALADTVKRWVRNPPGPVPSGSKGLPHGDTMSPLDPL